MKEFCKKWFSKEGLKVCFLSFIWLSAVIFVIDIISKWAVQNSLTVGQSVALIPNFLNVTLVHNLGAAFSLGANGEIGWRIFWIAVSIVLSGVLIFVFAKNFKKFTLLQKAALALMIGGALGNMIDRCFYWKAVVGFDGVVDWIDFQFGSWHFATFNLADAALVIGVFILIIVEVINMIKEAKEKAKRGEYDLPPMEVEAKQKENAENKDK